MILVNFSVPLFMELNKDVSMKKNCRVLEFSPSKFRHTCLQYSGLIVAKFVHTIPKVNVNCNSLYSLKYTMITNDFRPKFLALSSSAGVEKKSKRCE